MSPRARKLGMFVLVAGAIVAATLQMDSAARAADEERLARKQRLREIRRDAERGQVVYGLEQSEVDALTELGYAAWVSTGSPDVVGVTHHDRERAWPGLNLYASHAGNEARLVDMDGAIVHRWPCPGKRPWEHVLMQPGGRLLGISWDKRLDLVEWDGTPVWSVALGAHHDLDVDAEGRVLVLGQVGRTLTLDGVEYDVKDNSIIRLTAEGERVDQVWFSDLWADRLPGDALRAKESHYEKQPKHDHATDRPLDLFHCNTLEVLRRDVPGLGRAGQVLVSVRSMNLIAVVDLDEERVVWSWGEDELDRQHQPTVLDNGELLVFDNGRVRQWSRVIRVDPASGEITWEYKGSSRDEFYSGTRGGSEALPNGNVLICESNRGRVFEITPDGEVVWEFHSPDVKAHRRNALYRFHRLTEQELASLPPLDA